jgi:hypothetical protein
MAQNSSRTNSPSAEATKTKIDAYILLSPGEQSPNGSVNK